MSNTPIRVYGEHWCGDCQRAKSFLEAHGIPFEWIDVAKDQNARAYITRTFPGVERIPIVVFPDGSYLVEPTNAALADRLGLAE